MPESDSPPPPARPAGSTISDRAALEAAIAGAAGLLLGRVLLGRGAGLLAGTAAIAARLVSEALKSPAAPAGTDDISPAATLPDETEKVSPPELPEEEPVEVEDIGVVPEPEVLPEIPVPFAEVPWAGSGSREPEEPASSPAEVLFVELPLVEPALPVEPVPSGPHAAPETADTPLPAFPAWEAFASRQPAEPSVMQAAAIIPSDDSRSALQSSPDEASHHAASPLPAFPELADLADPEAIWKMAAAESAPVPAPEAETAVFPNEKEPEPAPAGNPFAALFASYAEPAPEPSAPAETIPIPELVPVIPVSPGVSLEEPAATSLEETGVGESTEFQTVSLPPDSTGTASALTDIPNFTPPPPEPEPAAGTQTLLPPAADPAELPLLSLKVPTQTPAGNTRPVPAPTGPNVTAPIEIVEAAAMEALGTPPPRQTGPPQPVTAGPTRRSSWRAWLLIALLAGGGAWFYWNEKQKADGPPPTPPAGGSSSSSSSPILPPPASTVPPAPVPAAPVVPAPAPPGSGTMPSQPKPPPPSNSPSAASQPVLPADAPLVAEPAPGVPQDFPPGSPEAIARQTLETLLAAKTVQELAPLVHQPAEALRLANAYFPDGDLKPSAWQRILFDAAESVPGTAFKSRLFRVVTTATPLGFPVAVEDTKEGPRVDFDAFVQCRDRLLDAFMANRSALPGRFLVVLRRGHYFGEDLQKEVLDRLLCLEISSPIPGSAKHPVFIPRSTELGKLAQRKFAWNQVYTPVVELSHSGTYVSLNAILQDTWQRSKH